VYWDFGGSLEGTTRLSVSGLTFGDNIWVFTTGARGMEIWQDGIRRASNTANPTRTATTTDDFMLGSGPSAIVSDPADCYFFYLYSRQLSPEECRWISGEPYSMLITPQYRRYFVAASGGGGWPASNHKRIQRSGFGPLGFLT
jgi:hypothetical protein